MAQVDGARFAGRQHLRAVRRLREAVGRQLAQRQAGLAGRREDASHLDVRAGADAGRRVVLADVGEQEQHQQRPSPRADVHAPFEEIGMVVAEARVDVPAGVAGIVRRREAHREGAQAVAPQPAPRSDELVEGRVQDRRVGGVDEGLLPVHPEADDGAGPRGRVARIAAGIAPQDGAGRVGDLPRERPWNPDEAVVDELPDVHSRALSAAALRGWRSRGHRERRPGGPPPWPGDRP